MPIGRGLVRFSRRDLIRREIRAVCALVNDSASEVNGDTARRRAMAVFARHHRVFPRHHRVRLVRCRDDDTLSTTFALNVVLRVRHEVHGLTRAAREPQPSSSQSWVIDDDTSYEFTHEHGPTVQERILP
jgi:hypothetical protein